MDGVARFVGGFRTQQGANGTAPFAALTVYPWGLELRIMFRRHRYTWQELSCIQNVIGNIGSRGIRIVPLRGQRIVFWTVNQTSVLDALMAQGAPLLISPNPERIWWGA